MAHDDRRNTASAEQAELTRQFEQVISRLDLDGLGALPRLLAQGAAHAVDPFERTPPPSRRRSRRSHVVGYQVRVDLKETTPPLWRRLELSSDLFLNDLHDVLQVAFGWTDSHLHRFGSGPDYYSPETEYYLCPFEVNEGETGIPEDEVRLDEVLIDVGDRLLYNYDFGDDWQHVIKLEKIRPRSASTARVICTDGRRPGPPEDCGGVPGYELIVAATDPSRADHSDAIAEFARIFGDDVDPANFDVSDFDADQTNKDLADLGLDDVGPEAYVPGPLADLARRVRTTTDGRFLKTLIRAAALDQPVHIDAATAARMARPYTWLLNRVGPDGIKLTSAGYLPPVDVEAAMTELGMQDERIGKHNRESQTLPVLDLRESAQKMGLLRKHRGLLVLTRRAHALRNDPLALWWWLAEHMPPRSTREPEQQAGLLFLLGVAAQVDDIDATVAQMLTALGWMGSDYQPVSDIMAGQSAWSTVAVLRRLGAFAGAYGPARPNPQGIEFARAALCSWPSPST